MSTELTREIRQIEEAVANMGDAVATRVSTALEAWFSWDADLARSIRQADAEIDRMDVDIEERCMQVLALHQPVASDLRTVLACLRIITSLERAADLARSIAKRVIKPKPGDANTIPADSSSPEAHGHRNGDRSTERPAGELSGRVAPPDVVITMGEGVLDMLDSVMKAFATGDIELARSVRRRDLHIDEMNRAVFRWAVEGIQREPNKTEGYFAAIVKARALERIGDMAANIAEDVIFSVGGSVVRHSPI